MLLVIPSVGEIKISSFVFMLCSKKSQFGYRPINVDFIAPSSSENFEQRRGTVTLIGKFSMANATCVYRKSDLVVHRQY